MFRSMHTDPKPILNRLRRIEGQVRGLERMVEEDAYCVDVLTQVAAVQTALEQVAVKVLEGHVRGCVATAVAKGGAEGEAKLDELMLAIGRFTRGRARLIGGEV
jgi:DNA-binding FrmR family transcriptional regulator